MKRIRGFLSLIAFAVAIAGAFASSASVLVDYGYKVGNVCHSTSVTCSGDEQPCLLDVPEDDISTPVAIFIRNGSQCGLQAWME